ncbi:MAG: sensor histidine kinase N-terminal domain-containing protein [Rhodocyclaceae bacterium]|nr:sensor histidine kinase N-terminal domain-containing protein [Rhodocyclaceae bacterium]
MNTVWFSLRRRLLTLLLGGVSVAWLITMALSYLDAHHEVDELFDAQLSQAAQTLLALPRVQNGDLVEDLGDPAHKYQRQLRFQIWRADGRMLMRSGNAPDTPLVDEDGFSESNDEDGHWRHYSQWNAARTLQVQVSENHYFRDDLIGQIAGRLLFPALFGLPLIGAWVWVATRKGLSSLDELAEQIARRGPQQLRPLIPAAAPSEIRPMVEALNGLFSRVEYTLEAEQRFTADAAHELRTPLAVLQAHLQVAQRARNDEEREQSLQQLQKGLQRASRLVDQMLQLARLDPQAALPDPQPVDLSAVCAEVCADIGPEILRKNLEFELRAEPGITIHGQPDWIRVLVRNLVDNATRYTPEGGTVTVEIRQTPKLVTLHVCDSGPGIPAAERSAVLRPFHRLDSGHAGGSGLGLAIVARIASLHQARLTLDDVPGRSGLAVTVAWPMP